jgi:thioredoxin reductase
MGKLKETGKIIEVKLPGSKSHLSQPFEVTANTTTSFTFDITVVATGSNGKYILKPQSAVAASGQNQSRLRRHRLIAKVRAKNSANRPLTFSFLFRYI